MNHIPVLKNEIVETFDYLKNREGGIFVDGTIGNAGHSISIIRNTKIKNQPARIATQSVAGGNDKSKLKIIGIDKDNKALEIAEKNIREAGLYDNFILVHDDYNNIKETMSGSRNTCPDRHLSRREYGMTKKIKNDELVDGALLDLGVSSMQFDSKERGFSFSEPSASLDMRMDQEQKITAAGILNRYPREKIEQILKEFGEERFARIISINIVKERGNKQFQEVGDLLSVLEKSIPVKIQKTSKIHFATRTFQALRIEINEELKYLEKTIRDFVDLLKPNSKLAIISFHSLEDRIVKQTFKELAKECICPPKAPICNCNHKAKIKKLTRKPIIPSEEEINVNPRSRSAKLRIVEKL